MVCSGIQMMKAARGAVVFGQMECELCAKSAATYMLLGHTQHIGTRNLVPKREWYWISLNRQF